MNLPSIQTFEIIALCWLLWKALKPWVVKSPLDNVPGPRSDSFVKGVFTKFFNNNAWAYHQYLAKTFGSIIKIRGPFGENELFIFDPKAMYHIFVKDQHIFEKFVRGSNLIFGEGLLSTLGEQHRKQRKMLNPVFSIAHMREMLPIFYDVTYKLRDTFDLKLQNGPQEIDVLSWMTRTALELIGQSGLGYSFDDLKEETVPHPFCLAAKALIPTLSKLRFVNTFLLPTLSTVGPARFRRWVVNILPWRTVHEIRDIVDTLHDTSVEIFESKKKALTDGDEVVAMQIGRGKDIMSILMKANMCAIKEESLTREELLGQMSTLIFAAMDTTTNALARLLYLLSVHQDAQDKLRAEIKEAKEREGGELTYDTVVSLPYLDAICRETLRLYAPVNLVRRIARQDVVIPLFTPIKGVDGQEIKEVFIPKNTKVFVGLLASNTSPELWGSDALDWKPERWLNPLPEALSAAHLPGIYSNLMTFVGGSRACIGFKFSQLEMKVVLMLLVESFRFKPTQDEILWQMTGITTPVVVGSKKTVPQLPLIVEKVL
ncbi:cytochrome P450 [Pholiota conissans]|uniref:Cytochrome P450 n=1 Tax=Pholiota conissans TaxID=109636 RepID=A0A9P5Z991_9AGAR|nr:cytochrome P450 [Pholiota conissans]